MTRSDLIWKWASYGVMLALTSILNYHVLTFLPLGAVPLLPVVAAVAVGVLEGPRAGAGFGACAGLLMSAATHGSALWICAAALAGWVCGLLAQYVLRRDLVGFLPTCLAAAAVCEAFQVLPRLLGSVAGIRTLLRVALPELLWTMVFALPVYAMSLFCCRHYGRIHYE